MHPQVSPVLAGIDLAKDSFAAVGHQDIETVRTCFGKDDASPSFSLVPMRCYTMLTVAVV